MNSLSSVSYDRVLNLGEWIEVLLAEEGGAAEELNFPIQQEEKTSRSFRASTKAKSKAHSPLEKRGRKVLANSTISLIAPESPASSSRWIDEYTKTKVVVRFYFSMFRFAMAYAWGCETLRATTQFNGAKIRCKGNEAAHAALSPVIHDDKIRQLMQTMRSQRYDQLSEVDKSYVRARFELDRRDERLLSSRDPWIRWEQLTELMSRLSLEQKQGSFLGTLIDFTRNATFEGPRASNRVDCHLESVLRPLEKELAEKCRTSSMGPKEALQELFYCYEKLLLQMQKDLQEDLDRLNDLQKCWENMLDKQFKASLTAELEDFATYVEAISQYQEAFRLRFVAAHQGVPELRDLQRSLNSWQSPKVHSQIVRKSSKCKESGFHFFTQNLRHLKNPLEEVDFHSGRNEVKLRIAEVKAQSSVLEEGFESLYHLMEMFWGANQDGSFGLESKEDFALKLNEGLVQAPIPKLEKKEPLSKRRLFVDPEDKENFSLNTNLKI